MLRAREAARRGGGRDDVDIPRDRALVVAAQTGDRDAFDSLYASYHRRLWRFCIKRLHDEHEAEDVVQEAFVRAWRALPTFGDERRFYPWLTGAPPSSTAPDPNAPQLSPSQELPQSVPFPIVRPLRLPAQTTTSPPLATPIPPAAPDPPAMHPSPQPSAITATLSSTTDSASLPASAAWLSVPPPSASSSAVGAGGRTIPGITSTVLP